MRRHQNIGLLKGLYFRFGAAHMDVIFFFYGGPRNKEYKSRARRGKRKRTNWTNLCKVNK